MSNKEHEEQEDYVNAESLAEELLGSTVEDAEALEGFVVEVEVVEEEKQETKSKRGRGSSSRSSDFVPSKIPAGTFVSLKALVYLGVPRNSASVRAVQTRLLELGYVEAGGEDQGWFGPSTGAALKKFQEDRQIEEDYLAGPETIEALFEGVRVELLA
jgi:peptidoglycan hydrolase-like protein with peptidoglycan-binding domain